MSVKRLGSLLMLPLVALIGGCDRMVLLSPHGYVAQQQSDIMLWTTALIALIVVPVMVAIGVVAWRYRASRKDADYRPHWEHSTKLELLVWAAPLAIIVAVGAVSWIGTHTLDPYRDLSHVAPGVPVTESTPTLQVEVVSLRWKWLFFYPQYGIASVNELAAPVGVPIKFKLTSSDMMDSFFVPHLAGMIYTMPGMQTELSGIIDEPGVYKGMSANYSGHGFTDMRFQFNALDAEGFRQWVAEVRASDEVLNDASYASLSQPSRAEPVHHFSRYTPDLYWRILNRCVDPSKVCMNEQMSHSARGHGDAHARVAQGEGAGGVKAAPARHAVMPHANQPMPAHSADAH